MRSYLRLSLFLLRQPMRWCWVVLAVVSIMLPGTSSAQTIMGVNVGTGNGNLISWYRPEGASCTTDGCVVTGGADEVRGPAGSSVVDGAGMVTWEDSIVNFNPVFETKNGGCIKLPKDAAFNSDLAVFVVFRPNGIPTSSTGNWWEDPGVLTLRGSAIPPAQGWGLVYRGDTLDFGANTIATPQVSAAGVSSFPVRNFVLAGLDITLSDVAGLVIDGTLTGGTVTVPGPGIANFAGDSIFVGHQKNRAPSTGFSGYFGDIIIYDQDLAPNQRNRVETYLAIKYGLTLGHDYLRQNQDVIYELDGVFDYHVIGLARHDGSMLDQRQSRPSDNAAPNEMAIYHGGSYTAGNFPALNSPAVNTNMFPSNSQFLMVGHDSTSKSFASTISGPGSTPNNRMTRRYKVTDDGGVGNVTLFFPDQGFAMMQGTNYYLVVSNDSVFETDDTFIQMTQDATPGKEGYFVTHNFPDDQTSFFTIATTNEFKGPGGVFDGLQLWVKADTGLTIAGTTTWDDISGAGNGFSATAAGLSLVPGGINFNDYLATGPLVRNFPTVNAFVGQTIFVVGRATGSIANGGYVGFDDDEGVRQSGTVANPIQIRKNGNGDDWTNGGGGRLERDGQVITGTTLIDTWSVIGAEKGMPHNSEVFYLGGYEAARSFSIYNFAEVIVFDNAKATTTDGNKIDSYLALKYGITLDHNYFISGPGAGTLVYNVASAYDIDIAGIGRDTISLLDQRQSKSINPDAIVTIGNDSIYATNAANPNPMPERDFFVWGNNGGDLCYSNEDIELLTRKTGIYRLDREWGYTETNPGGNAITLKFQMDPDDPDFDLPPLPTGVSTYYLFLDDDGNFRNGGTDTFPMVQNGPLWEVDLTLTQRNLSSLDPEKSFTFGYFTDPALPDAFCYGDTIEFIGSNFEGGICSEVVLRSATRTFVLTEDATIGDSMFVPLPPTTTGNCIDTLRWIVSDSLPKGRYAVRIRRQAGCTGSFLPAAGEVRTQYDSITVGSGIFGQISFTGMVDSLYLCLGDPNPIILVDTGPVPPDSGASFLMLSSTNSIAINQIMNTSAPPFEVYVNSGNVGRNVIGYDPGGSCPDYDSVIVIIDALQPSFAAYAANNICQGNTGVQALGNRIPQAGYFASYPPLVGFNSSTGAFSPMANDTGRYAIVYNPTDSCYAPDTFLLRIEPQEFAVFDYGLGEFCKNDSNPFPNITYLPSNVDSGFKALGANAANLVINSVTGEINLMASDTGTYRIAYSLAGTCSIDTVDTIRIKPLPTVDFTMPSQVCTTTPFVIPNLTTGAAFHRWSNWTGNLEIDSVSGIISVDSSDVGGPYPVVVRKDSTNGCSDSTVKFLSIVGVPSTAMTYPAGRYCQSDSNPFPIIQMGVGGGNFFVRNTVMPSLDTATGEINLPITAVGTYLIEYALPATTCPADTIVVRSVTIDTVPDASFTLSQNQICFGDSTPITLTYTDLTWIHSGTINDSSSVVLGPVVGSFVAGGLPGNTTYSVQNTARDGSFGCIDTAMRFITVLPQQDASFYYDPDGIICDNVDDPTPIITGVGGGLFYSDTMGTFPAAIPDSSTGVLDLDGSPGQVQQVIYYFTPGPCPAVGTDTVQVLPSLRADFSYPSLRLCNRDTLLVPDNVASNTGTWAIDPPGLGINLMANGEIDLIGSSISSPVGTDSFLVQHFVGGGNLCADTFEVALTLTEFDTSWAVAYPPGVFCKSTDQAFPVITRKNPNQMGRFIQPPGLLFDSLAAGIVSIDRSSIASHIIAFESQGACEERATTSISIINDDDANFAYGSGSICFADSNTTFLPTFVADSNGVFFAIPISPFDTIVFVNDSTGEVNVSASTPGEYTFFHRTYGNCPDTTTSTVFINGKPDAGEMVANPGTSVCDSQEVFFSLTGTLGGTTSYFWNGVPQAQSPTWNDIGFETGDTVMAVIENAFSCRDTAFVVMSTTPKPETRIITKPDVLTGEDPVQITISPSLDRTQIFWSVISGDFITVDRGFGVTDTLNTNENETLENLINLRSDIIPDSLTYVFTAISNGCIGDQDSITIYVNPNEFPVFVPEVMTPNGDGVNDTWKIQLQSGLLPERFQMTLYNPAGGVVLEMNPIRSDYNGGSLPDGVYWWVLKDLEGELADFAGGLTIRRK